jgi:hypothetical protein
MVFLIGPRQCGKTTLAKSFLGEQLPGKEAATHYFNWDNARIRAAYRANPYFFEGLQLHEARVPVVFDEIHKMKGWKNYLKGAYDSLGDSFRFLITGSGRLDLFQRSGDSLAGRYDPFFLMPLVPAEIESRVPATILAVATILGAKPIPETIISDWEALGGFPEPFLSGKEGAARRWWAQYKIRVAEEDVRDLTRIEAIDKVRDLMEILPARTGSPLSLNALREDLEVAHASVANYVRTLQQVFLIFSVPPYSRKIARAIKKEEKSYFFHHPAVLDPGSRFENMVAILLKRWACFATESGNGEYALQYIRDQDRREVDFLLTLDGKPHLLLEAKRSDTTFTTAGLFYHHKLNIPLVQVVRTPNISIRRREGCVVSIHRLAALC